MVSTAQYPTMTPLHFKIHQEFVWGVLSEMGNGARDLAKDNVDGLKGLTAETSTRSDVTPFWMGLGHLEMPLSMRGKCHHYLEGGRTLWPK